jgi:hypothetical protein
MEKSMTFWWRQKPMRMIQTNLREIDATLDIDIRIQCPRTPKNVRCLWSQHDLDFIHMDGTLQFTVPQLSLLELIVIQMS